jgi:hypothetical protein
MLESPDHKASASPNGGGSTSDRRRSVRIVCTGFAEGISTGPSQLFRGEIWNISDSGCFISTRAAVAPATGTVIELRFKFGGAAYTALARVVEALPSSGIRIRFVAIEPRFSEHMRRILGANPDTPMT